MIRMAHDGSVFRETFNFRIGTSPIYQLKNKTRDSLNFIQRLKLDTKLEAHSGCVNTICWNETGTHILSGSDDQHLSITDPFSKKIAATIHSGHRANIFSARFLPNTQDRRIISCSGDGVIYYTQADREETYGQNAFVCHYGTAYEVQTIPQDPNSFLSCGEDCTVRWFDLRIKTKCGKPDCKEDILINCRRAVTALAVNPISPWQLSVGCSDSSVRVFDRRMLGTRATGNYTGRGLTGMVSRFTTPLLESRSHRITSLAYSPCGDDVLVSYSSDYIYMFNLKEDGRAQKFELSSVDGQTTVTSNDPDPPADGKGNDSQRYPPIKRLRLRGDWSDTGPNARPERERAEQGEEDRGSVNIMQRMSEMLMRLLEGAARPGAAGQSEQEQQGGATGGTADPSDPSQPAAELSSNQNNPGGNDSSAANTTADSATGDRPPEQSASDPVPSTSDQVSDGTVMPPGDNSGNLEDLSGRRERSDQSGDEATLGAFAASADPPPTQTLTAVQAISQTIQEEKIEPVISLQYRTEGTSASTIRVELANVTVPSETLVPVSQSMPQSFAQPVVPQSMSQPVSHLASQSLYEPQPLSLPFSQPNNPVPPVIESDSLLRNAVTESNPLDASASAAVSQPMAPQPAAVNNIERTESNRANLPDNSENFPGDRGCSGAPSDIGQPGDATNRCNISETSFTNDTVHGVQSDLEASELKTPKDNVQDSHESHDTSSSSSNVDSPSNTSNDNNGTSSAENTSNTSVNETVNELVTEALTDAVAESVTETVTQAVMESADRVIVQNQDPEQMTLHLTPQISVEEYISPEREEPPSEETTENQQDSQEMRGNNDSDSAEGFPSFQNTSPLMTRSLPRAGSSGVGASVRQRRFGHSGPPTGDFQLHSDDNEDEDDSDTELMRAHQNKYARPTRDENLAARRLQALYRKRQEEKEKEEWDSRCVHQPALKQIYKGHRNARTMIKEANFWSDKYVMSGSDCGHIFIWDRYSGHLVKLLEADKHVVNCIQPHPYFPILASSGIDYDIKIWTPSATDPTFDEQTANEIMARNEVMLEETRDTITVPASFMLRMLASLNHVRASAAGRRGQGNSPDEESTSSDED